MTRTLLAATFVFVLAPVQLSAQNAPETREAAVRYRALLSKLGVEGIISNHTDYDSTIAKIQALAARKPGDRHPFLTGAESVRRHMTVVEEVGRATLAAIAGAP